MSTFEGSAFSKPLVSQLLAEDADLRDIVEEFVDNLTERVEEMQQAFQKTDWEMLTTFAHRLKGAAGSYGYPDISKLCAEMEQRFRAHEAEAFTAWMAELNQLAGAAREGLTEEP